MKTPLLFALVVSAVVGSMAFGGEPVGKKQQAIGEQCSILTNYIEPSDGCGNSSAGDIKMDLMATLEGQKTYNIEVDVINEADQIELAFSDYGVRYSQDETYTAKGVLWAAPGLGRYQLNLRVVNAVTGVTVCTSQSLVTAN